MDERERRREVQPLKVLFVVPYAPTRIRTRPFHLIRALAGSGHQVTVASVWGDAEEREALDVLASAGARAIVTERLSRLRAGWNCGRALFTRDPLQAHYSWHPALARRLAELSDTAPPDVIHVEHLRGAKFGLGLVGRSSRAGRAPVPVIWDAVDCISTLFRRTSRESTALRVRLAARLELRRTERFEGRVVGQFDRVLVTSEHDRSDLLSLAPDAHRHATAARCQVIPNGVDLSYFCPGVDVRRPATLVVTGKMGYHANATAAVRFVRDVMPVVWRSRPDATLLIVGKDPPREVVRLQDGSGGVAAAHAKAGGGLEHGKITVTGAVDDIRPFLRSATLAVAPIQYGVGIQNKVLEALACGTPVVATPQAVTALSAGPGEGIEVGATPGELAALIVSLLSDADRRDRLGRLGRAYVERVHGWERAADRLAGIYRDAIAESHADAV